ncbi:MAG: hypothetical protein K2I52_00820 [Muribaculaceae bacterium]|nr:hypothetical protein [Muribaculaceae bacterium]
MNIKYLLCLFMLMLPTVASAKFDQTTRNRLMQEAGKKFQAGSYEEARRIYYDIYVEDGDEASRDLLDKCKKSISLLADATAAERNGMYETAIEKYREVISLNPSDSNTQTLIAECKQRINTHKLQLEKK